MDTFYYPEKRWFQYVTKLNASGLIPGETLTELHVTKKECQEMFLYGGEQSNNGYRINTSCSFFNERLQWLWLRVHQVEKPTNNDFGLSFAQSIIYEYKTNEEVDWAELAVRTVNRFSRTRGVKSVHPLWAWAHPSVTINLESGIPVGRDYHFPNTPGSRPIRMSLPSLEAVINTPRPETRSKRRLKLPMSSDYSTEIDSGSDRQKIRSRRSTARYESPVQRSGQPSGAPGVNVGSTSMTMTHSALESPPKSEAMHRVQPPNGPTESHAAGPSRSALVADEAPLPRKVQVALIQFGSDIPKLCESIISNLELQKAKLHVALESAHDQASLAKSTKSELNSELLKAKMALFYKDDDETQGEVRYIQSALKCAEGKVEVAVEREKEALSALQAVCTKIEDQRKAHRVLEEHFLFNNGSVLP